MSDKFQNKYRIPSARLQNWDYSEPGNYFITMVTQNRECNLGEIENDEMILSDFGKIVETEWYESFEIRNELFLNKFIIMPNHLHAIITILNENETNGIDDNCSDMETHGRRDAQPCVSTPIFERNPKSISSFIGGFKSSVNSKIDDYIDNNNLDIPKYNKNNHFWQSRFHDHVIRDENEYQRIKQYIINNPTNWDNDKLHH